MSSPPGKPARWIYEGSAIDRAIGLLESNGGAMDSKAFREAAARLSSDIKTASRIRDSMVKRGLITVEVRLTDLARTVEVKDPT